MPVSDETGEKCIYPIVSGARRRPNRSRLDARHHLVLVLSRGGHCPEDRWQAEGLVQLHRELETLGMRLFALERTTGVPNGAKGGA
jgi:hypothetical protein